jgi:hypothetical protein
MYVEQPYPSAAVHFGNLPWPFENHEWEHDARLFLSWSHKWAATAKSFQIPWIESCESIFEVVIFPVDALGTRGRTGYRRQAPCWICWRIRIHNFASLCRLIFATCYERHLAVSNEKTVHWCVTFEKHAVHHGRFTMFTLESNLDACAGLHHVIWSTQSCESCSWAYAHT